MRRKKVKQILSIMLCMTLLLAVMAIPVGAEGENGAPYKVTIGQPEKLAYNELDTIQFEMSITGGTADEPAYFANHSVYIGRDLGHMTNTGPSVEDIGFSEISQVSSEIELGEKIVVRAKLGQSELAEPYDAYIVVNYEDYDGSQYAYSNFKLRITPDGFKAPERVLNGSSWAMPELTKADNYGLITEKLQGDLTAPITREEFAELSVRLYEVYTGNTAEPVSPNPFSDTTNSEILKANALGIVSGVGGGKFDPNALTNREQIAAMLNRAVKIIAPDADLSTSGAPAFTDEKAIAPYFLENVKFMGKNGFIKGSNGAFSPKGTCTREMAVLIAVRVYEFYKNN